MKSTIYDVAHKAGVSIATVSKVINQTGRISDKTRKLVTAVMKEMGYEPSMIASAMTRKSTLTIGVLIPDLSNPFFASLARSIEDRGHHLGYNIMICSTDYDPDKELKYITLLKRKSVDGIILVSGFEQTKMIADLISQGMPTVVVAREIPSLEVDTVSIDNFLGGFQAAKHLLSLGHKKTAVITRDLWSNRERVRGFKQALQEEGIELEQDIKYATDSSLENGRELACQLLESPDRPTAIFACDDPLAIGAVVAAREFGLSVPDQLSVIGFDDTIWAKVCFPPLTTIAQPLYDIGSAGMDLLVQEIKGQKSNKQRIILLPKLVIRESTMQI